MYKYICFVETSSETVSLMQIDCEVVDTRLLHVNSAYIPEHLRSFVNYTRNNYGSNEAPKYPASAPNITKNKFYTPYFIKNSTTHSDFLYLNKKNKPARNLD